LVAADAEQIVSMVGPLPALAVKLAAEFWPGRLTLLLTAPARFAESVSGGTGRVGVRVPDHAVARGLCRSAGSVLTATSANISGQPASNDPDVVAASIGADVDVLVDAGKTAGGPPSTIVDVTGPEVRLVRAGAISWEQVQACLAK
jgi:L-threonylcarbamoyladenylate synthase